jgi:MFS family permease
MQLIFLPYVPPEKDMPGLSGGKAALAPAERKIPFKAWLCIALMFVSMALGMVFLLKMAIIVSERGLGDSALAGVLNSTQIMCAFLSALTFPLAFKRLGRWTIVVPIIATALSFLFIAAASNVPMVFIGCGIFGIYLGYSIPYLQTVVSSYTHPVRRTFALALLSTAMFAGQACSTPFVALLEAAFGPNTSLLFGTMSVIVLVLLLATALYLFVTRHTTRRPPYAETTEFDNVA